MIPVLCQPREQIGALVHKGGQREPETVVDGEVVGDGQTPAAALVHAPFVRRESGHQKQDHAESGVIKCDCLLLKGTVNESKVRKLPF